MKVNFYASRAAALHHVSYRVGLLAAVAGLLRQGAQEGPAEDVLGRMETELREIGRVLRDLRTEEGEVTPA